MTQDMKKEPILQMGYEEKGYRGVLMKNLSRSEFLIDGMERGVSTRQKGRTDLVYRWFQNQQGHWSWGVLLWNKAETKFHPRAVKTVFQAEMYAIKACTDENIDKNYKNRNIYILSDSQAAIQALDKYQITSKLVWDCHQSLM
jgi:hypothetical protein